MPTPFRGATGRFAGTSTQVKAALRLFTTLAGAVAAVAALSWAGPIVIIPPTLAPGQQYRLVFTTADNYLATSTDIAFYNSSVNAEAGGVVVLNNLGTTWTVIGSTSAVNAIDNIGLSNSNYDNVPIYNLSGQLVANGDTAGAGGIFSGVIQAPINGDELGAIYNASAWTGTQSNGIADTQFQLGSTLAVTVWGFSYATDSTLIHNSSSFSANLAPLYAISGVLAAPAPEPTTIVTTMMGFAILGLTVLRRQARARSRHHLS